MFQLIKGLKTKYGELMISLVAVHVCDATMMP